MHGDAADEMVRMVLNGTEVAIKLTGSAAKNLAALLVAWSKNEKKVYGKTTMMKLLKSGEPLQVLSMTKEQYSKFKGMAKKKVLYAPFLNKKRGDNKLDVVISEKSLPMVNHILKKIGYGEVAKTQPEVEETKKKILGRGKTQTLPRSSRKHSKTPDPKKSRLNSRRRIPSRSNWDRTADNFSGRISLIRPNKKTRSAPLSAKDNRRYLCPIL